MYKVVFITPVRTFDVYLNHSDVLFVVGDCIAIGNKIYKITKIGLVPGTLDIQFHVELVTERLFIGMLSEW